MAVPILRPGLTHAAVPRMKKELVRELLRLDLRTIAALIRPDSKTYGTSAVRGVRRVQAKRNLKIDGIVGKDTWRALGVDDEVVDLPRRKVLNGVPGPDPGTIEFDARWVDEVLARQLLKVRNAGRWRGRVFSGYRPPWYQKLLFDDAVKRYGSVEKARKFVAPPGKSRHGKVGGQGAVDVTPNASGADLDAFPGPLFRPMSHEPWHVQMHPPGPQPPGFAEEAEVVDEEPPTEELAESGLTVDDVHDAIAVYLEGLDIDEDEVVSEGFEGEAPQ